MLRQWSIGRRLSLVTLMVLALLGLLLFFCLQKYFLEGVTVGAVKG